mgnify:CR=1 FL=1
MIKRIGFGLNHKVQVLKIIFHEGVRHLTYRCHKTFKTFIMTDNFDYYGWVKEGDILVRNGFMNNKPVFFKVADDEA